MNIGLAVLGDTTHYYSDPICVVKHWALSILICNLITDSSFILGGIRAGSDLGSASSTLAALLLAHTASIEKVEEATDISTQALQANYKEHQTGMTS